METDKDQLLTEMDPAQGAATAQARGGARNPSSGNLRKPKKLWLQRVT